MTVTPQTNATLDDIARTLAEHDDFCLCGHVSPDGDCLGSQLALARALKLRGKRVTCVLAKDEPVEAGLAFLPGADELVSAASYVADGVAQRRFGVFVGVDVPTPGRWATTRRRFMRRQRSRSQWTTMRLTSVCRI